MDGFNSLVPACLYSYSSPRESWPPEAEITASVFPHLPRQPEDVGIGAKEEIQKQLFLMISAMLGAGRTVERVFATDHSLPFATMASLG